MHYTVPDLDINGGQAGAFTGTGNTNTADKVKTGAMVGTHQPALRFKQELIRRPVQGTALVWTGVQISFNSPAQPEQGYIPVAVLRGHQHLFAGFRRDFFEAAKRLQFDSPGGWPYV